MKELGGGPGLNMRIRTIVMVPVAGLIVAAFVRRRSRTKFANSRRADAAAFHQRFSEASVLLGDSNPVARAAAVAAIAGLALDGEDHRQRCVDVLCAYMRMPVELREKSDSRGTAASPLATEIADRGENEVRNFLVRALAQLLSDRRVQGGEPVNIDLREVTFGDQVNFSSVNFNGGANFTRAIFTGYPLFADARFKTYVRFDRANFGGYTDFTRTTFHEGAGFTHVTFGGGVNFDRGIFAGPAYFSFTTFGGIARFDHTTFAFASFAHTRFMSHAYFFGVNFEVVPKFGVGATFQGATFTDTVASLSGSTFSRGALGPVRKDCDLPSPPGELVDSSGVATGDAVWAREKERSVGARPRNV